MMNFGEKIDKFNCKKFVVKCSISHIFQEVISEWMETIIDSWNDLVMDRSASHVIRSFAALLLGISQSKGGIFEVLSITPYFLRQR